MVSAAHHRQARWSTFEDTRDYVPLSDDRMPTLQGEVAHFGAKAEDDAYFRELNVPTAFLYTSAGPTASPEVEHLIGQADDVDVERPVAQWTRSVLRIGT